ncbi:sensor histidine kinase [Sphaerotilus mobilis]|uniref:histidine kinase n=1 Tax=Sphaerotilus mobilis TaxID=47994 RepID=A0A4Q7LJ03_9BURK|nr:ATP-binding protein [Sphaerotilus mobilis]RZS53419.1 phospho-acceptor domain-containing protein [Sphaerotilus mobilis]
MDARPQPLWRPLLLGLALALLVSALLLLRDRAVQREAFETQARIAHRLLSQQAVQHEAILGTLVLLQADHDAAAGQGLSTLFAQILSVDRRGPGEAWPDPAWAEAEDRATRSGHAEAVTPDTDAFSNAGRLRLVQPGKPASYALQIDLARMVPRAEWPERVGDSPDAPPLRMALQVDGGPSWALPLPAGTHVDSLPSGGWSFEFRKHLAAASQPFDLVVRWHSGWSGWPWWGLLASWVLSLGSVFGLWRLRRDWQAQAERQRRAEAQLRFGQVARLNALGELAAGIAHELNQPLTAVLASTQAAGRLLAEDPPELDDARSAMQRAVRQARRASEVLQRLRALVRPGSDVPAADEAAAVALAPAVRHALDLLAGDLDRLAVQPALDLPEPLAVQADAVTLEQILHNLLSNALQALTQVPPAERRLVISAHARGPDAIELRVTDHGLGVPEAQRAQLFEPFFTTRDGGLGLGLSLCETLAASAGGSLHFEPAEPRGAVFVLRLPASVTAPQPRSTTP